MSSHKKTDKKPKRMNMGGPVMGGSRGMGLPPGLAKKAPADMPKGLTNRMGGMPKGLQPRPGTMTRPGFADRPMKMAAGGKVRGAGAAKRGLKISKKMG